MIPCICIDDSNRPGIVPIEKWVKKGQEYHIINVYWMVWQKRNGVDLAEIELGKDYAPYEVFLLKRFAIPLEFIEDFVNLCKASTEMEGFDINEMVKELEKKAPAKAPTL